MTARVITENSTGGTNTGILDTALWEDSPAANFNSEDVWRVCGQAGEHKHQLVAITIPNDGPGTITSADLAVKALYADGSSASIAVSQIVRVGVDFTQATWAQYSTGNNWGTAGALNTSTDRGASPIWTGTVAFDDTVAHLGVGAALNSAVQALCNGGGTLYLVININPPSTDSSPQFFYGCQTTDGSRPVFSYTHTASGGGTADHLTFTTQPSSTVVGDVMGNVTVAAKDSGGTTDATFTGNITVALQAGTGTLNGTKTVAAVAGVATFNTLSNNTLSAHNTLRATASGLTQIDSSDYAYIAGTGGTGGGPFDSGLFS